MRRRVPVALVAAAVPLACLPGTAQATTAGKVTVEAGDTWVVPRTTRLSALTIAPGGAIAAPEGHSLTMTVNGVETGGLLTRTGGTQTAVAAGTYRGDVVVTVADANPVSWQKLVFPFRQALYVDDAGVSAGKSVPAAVVGGRLGDTSAENVKITSTGEAFNGVYVKDGVYALVKPRIELTGNGRSDFVGYGAAIVGTGAKTRLVVDGATVSDRGAVRTGVVADGGANVIVKNSHVHTANGVLPSDYRSTVDLTYMQQAPWMLGIVGNVRATNLLGENTRATYVNSAISSEGWGVLSTDTGKNGRLTAIASTVTTTGGEGYGAYAIGGATERFLGSRFDVDTYAAINRGGAIYFGDSSRTAVSKLNVDLDLGLSAKELAAIPVRGTVVNSKRWGVMWHGAGSVDVSGGTVINTGETTFLDKGQQVTINVNGSQGARLNPGNGVILQVMEDDDPGPQMVDGVLLNTGVYHEPTGDPAKAADFDVTSAHAEDATATFTDITLKGDFYNAVRGGSTGGQGPGAGLTGRNMVLNFSGSKVTGVISAARATHQVDTITSAEYKQLGVVTNTPRPSVNNGAIVNLSGGSTWTVTGTSHLTNLAVSADSTVAAAAGKRVTMTVNGVQTPIVPGQSYTGAIVLTVG
ncbi:hypothetical protein ACQP2K_02840 [Microbispora siamensis]